MPSRSQVMTVLGTRELSAVSCPVFRKFLPTHCPTDSLRLLDFPHQAVPSVILRTHLQSRDKHFFLSGCCKVPVRGNAEPPWDLGGQRNVSIQQLTRRYIKCQSPVQPVFYCATLRNRTRNRETRTPSRKAVHPQTTDEHSIV